MKAKYTGATIEQIRWGNNDDPRGLLEEGRIYEVLEKEVHSWHTKLKLKGFSSMKFNSANFELIEEEEN